MGLLFHIAKVWRKPKAMWWEALCLFEVNSFSEILVAQDKFACWNVVVVQSGWDCISPLSL